MDPWSPRVAVEQRSVDPAGGNDIGFHVVATAPFGDHSSSLLADFTPSLTVVATRVAEAAHQIVGSALERGLAPMSFPGWRIRHFVMHVAHRGLARDYNCSSSRSLARTAFWVSALTLPRYRARLEQWIVASLCKRSADRVLRFVALHSGAAGSRTRSNGSSWVGTTDEI